MGFFDDLIPAAAPAAGGAGFFDDLIPKKEQVGAVKGAGLGLGKSFANTGRVLGAAATAPAVIADAVASLFAGRPVTGAQDFAFGLAEPALEAPKFYDLDPATQEFTTGGKVGNVVGNLAGAVAQMGAMPGAVPANTGRLALGAAQAGLPGTAANIIGRHALAPSFVKGAPLTVAQPIDTYSRVLDAGGSALDAAKSAAAESALNTAAVAVPLSASGGLARRVGTGAAMGLPINLAQQAGVNATLEDFPQLQQPVMTPENLGMQTALPAVMAGLFGPRAAATRPGAPPPQAPPPDISGNVVPGGEKSVAQIIAEATGIPTEGPRAAYDAAQTTGERAIAQQQMNQARTERARELGRTFRGYPSELPPNPQQTVPASQDAAIRQAYEAVGTTPDSVAAAFMRGRMARDGVLDIPEAQRDITARQNTRTLAGEAFDVADAQRGRKQGAQDDASLTAQPRDLQEARAGGTTSPEGTAAMQPETFTFLDIQRSGNRVLGTGPQVEIVRELMAKDGKGKDVPAYEVRYEAENGEVRTEIVDARRVGDLSRPANPRFAQDVAATTYAPRSGVGTGPQQPAPRRAGQRITTEASPELLGTDMPARVGEPPRQPNTIDGESARVPDAPTAPRYGGRLPPQDSVLSGGAVEQPRGPDLRAETPQEADARLQADRAREAESIPFERRSLDAEIQGRADPEAGTQARQAEAPPEVPRETPPQQAEPGPQNAAEAPAPAAPKRRGGRRKTPTDDARIADPDYRSAIDALARGSGWDEVGGRVVRDEMDPRQPVVGRTKWAGQEWWEARPADARLPYDIDGDSTRAAIKKTLADEPLSAREKRAVKYMLDVVGRDIEEGRLKAEEARLEQEGKALADEAPARDDAADDPFDSLLDDAFSGNRKGSSRNELFDDDADFGLKSETPAELRARDASQRAEAERQSARENAPPAEDFTLAGSDRAADQAEARGQKGLLPSERPGGMTLEEARAYMEQANRDRPLGGSWDDIERMQGGKLKGKPSGGGTLYANPIEPLFGWAKEQASAWREQIGEFAKLMRKKGPEIERHRSLARAVFDTYAGEMQSMVDKSGSKTARWIHQQFAAKAGGTEATAETVQSAMNAYTNQRLTELDRFLRPFAKDEVALKQIVNGVRNPGSMRAGTPIGDAAIGLRAMLDDALKHMQDSGVDVKGIRKGYYPRQILAAEVMAKPKAGQTTFVDAAARAYREAGIPPKEARLAAEELHDSIVFGQTNSLYRPGGGQGTPFVQHRVFGKEVDNPSHPMHRFLDHDPMTGLGAYFDRVAKRAEIAKRFGDNFANWEDLARKMRAEGAGGVIEPLMDFVQTGAGIKRTGGGVGVQALSSLRAWGALMFLEKATLTSLPEAMMPGIRAGNLFDVPKSIGKTITTLAGTLKGKERRAFAEDLGLVTSHIMDQLQVSRFVGDNPLSRKQHVLLNAYFRRTGLTQFTEATTVVAADLGRIVLRRLSLGEGTLNNRYLAELGIPADKAAQFSDYVKQFGERLPVAGDLKGDMGELYRAAIRRFASQSIMRPDQTLRPGWMSTPIGSVMGQLQSFNYAFYENVIKRSVRLAKDASSAEGYSKMERLEMVKPLAMLPLLAAGAFVIGEPRDALLGDPDRYSEEDAADKMLKALSRGVPIGPIDPVLNWASGAKYNQTTLGLFAGPVIGQAGKGADAVRDWVFNDNEYTNSAERRAAKALYDLLIEPSLNVLLYAVPAGPILSPAASAATVMGIPMARDDFVDAVAGERKEPGPRMLRMPRMPRMPSPSD